MAISIGLSDAPRGAVVKIRSALLADGYVLYTQTRNDHWHVTGRQFKDLHKFFEAQDEELDDVVDEVAERASALGGTAVGPSPSSPSSPRLGEEPGRCREAPRMLANLLADHEAVVRGLRTDLQTVIDRHADAGPPDFLTGLMDRHEKMAWVLRAFWTGHGAGPAGPSPAVARDRAQRDWGSSQSRRPSPRRFAPSTTAEIARPGTVPSHQAFDR